MLQDRSVQWIRRAYHQHRHDAAETVKRIYLKEVFALVNKKLAVQNEELATRAIFQW